MNFNLNNENISKLIKKGINIALATSIVLTLTACSSKVNDNIEEPSKQPPQEAPVTSPEAVKEDTPKSNLPNYQKMDIKQVFEAMGEHLDGVNSTLNVPFIERSISGAVLYIDRGFNPENFDGQEDSDTYSALGMIAAYDLNEDGKFSDYWYNIVQDASNNEIFINEILLPVEQAYTSNDFSTLMSKMNAYDGKTDNHWNNVTISMLHHIMRNNQNINNEDKQKIEKYFEDLYYQYYDGTLFSQNENQVARRA